MASFRRILVATDFTETSQRAIDAALELATRLGASLTVMHAYEIPIVGVPDGALIATPELAARISEAARSALDSTLKRLEGRGVQVQGVLRDGVAWEEIEHVANDIDADVIVIGTHGRRGIARALLGSVAENVIRTTYRPVLTIHGPPHGPPARAAAE
jgi:nucleotide-binding universal stress UspA family protein